MNYREKVESLSLISLQKLKKEYEKAYINPAMYEFNVFSMLNLREDSHTELLAWLLNAKNKPKDSIQYKFLRDFLRNDYLNIKSLEIDIFNDKILDKLISGLDVKTQKYSKDDKGNKNGKIDIFMISKPVNFVCIIEVKLDAKTSVNKEERDQLDRYRSFLEKYYEDYKKCLIFLCTAVDKQVEQKKYVSKLLNKSPKYQVIEYSDIALIIYNILKDNYTEPSHIREHNETTNFLLEKFVKLNFAQQKYKEKLVKIKKLSNSINENKSILDVPITDSILCKTLNYEKPKNYNLPMRLILELGEQKDNKNKEFVNKLLKQYVQFWEYSNCFVSGYSKIVNGYYICDILSK